MKRTTITIPDDLESRINEHLQTPDAPSSLSAVVQAAVEEYLERRPVDGLRQPCTGSPADQIADLSQRRGDTNHDNDHVDGTTDEMPKFLMLDDLTQEQLDKLDRCLNITPAKQGSGFSDVSVNHDKYLAEDS